MASCFTANYSTTKYFYFGVFAITAVLTWILRDYAAKPLSHVGPMRSCLSIQDVGLQVRPGLRSVVLPAKSPVLVLHPQQKASLRAHSLCRLTVQENRSS